MACTSDTLCRDCWGILASRPWPGPPPVAPIPSPAKLRGSGSLDCKVQWSPRVKRKKSGECFAVRPATHQCPSLSSNYDLHSADLCCANA